MTDEALALEPDGELSPDENASPEKPEVVTEPDGQTQQTEGKGSESDSSPDPKDSGDISDKHQKRINKLTWQREEEKRLRQAAERERDHLKSLVKAQELEPMKSKADFGYDDDRWNAYVAERASKTAVQSAQQELARSAQEADQHRRDALFSAKEAEFAVDHPDYYQMQSIVGSSISPEMAQAIKGSDEGPALVHHLGKNPGITAYITQLSPLSAARELGRIEARLIAERDRPKPPPVSKAPPPAAKIAPADPGVEKDPAKMTDAEFAKWRRKQIAQRGN